MSFDVEPDAPLHGECAAEIKRLEMENAKLRAVADAAKNYFTEDLDSGIDMSRKWFKSYNMVKDALAALETTNG